MTEQTTVLTPSTGPAVRCTGCGSSMAADQKYCLECGKRKGDPRVEFEKYMDGGRPGNVQPPDPPGPPAPAPAPYPYDPRPVREVTPLMAAGGLAAFAVILLLGVIVGRMGGEGSSQTPVMATTGVPTTTAAAPETSTSTDVTVAFQADWPSGKEGFTVELATVPKDSTDGAGVEATKADLASKGAGEVGALDSDEFASMPAGNYVFYSGVFDTKADAETALNDLKTGFPDAQVVEVSKQAATVASGGGGGGGGNSLITDDPAAADANPDKAVQASKDDLAAIDGADAGDFQELQDKLPPTIQTPGDAPAKDGKAPGGGGGDAVSIG